MFNKRVTGWLKWIFERRQIHRPEVLAALVADLQITRPDHVAITGDLTNLGLEEEFIAAGAWLRRLGDRQYVSLVPGNHDAYIPTPWSAAWSHWKDYLDSDVSNDALLHPDASFQELTDTYFPSVRFRGPLALIGVCTAQPVGVFRASGKVGAPQLERLERCLRELAATDFCRIVLIHHPPLVDPSSWRALHDNAAVRDVVRRCGADLILHGHAHMTIHEHVPGAQELVPVIGVRSASDIGSRPDRGAQYHLYRIERQHQARDSRRFRITMEVRGYDPKRREVQFVKQQLL
jgi:3',5'-cyclic AMP phosphodiesterase CpdA